MNEVTTFQISYHTENRYENSVLNAHWQLLVLPETNSHQELLSYSTRSNITINEYLTPHLFSGDCLNIKAVNSFDKFELSVEIYVNIKPYNPFDFNLLSIAEEKEAVNNIDYKIEHCHFLQMSRLTSISGELISIFPLWGEMNLIDYLKKLMVELGNHITYESGKTEVQTTATEVLTHKKGVCQDFSHVMLAVLRQQEIAARYVCGYLNQGGESGENAQLHAWVECYIPGGDWIGVDPANNLFADHNYIKISHGRDFNDCTPIIGVLNTSGGNETEYSVKVSQMQQNQ